MWMPQRKAGIRCVSVMLLHTCDKLDAEKLVINRWWNFQYQKRRVDHPTTPKGWIGPGLWTTKPCLAKKSPQSQGGRRRSRRKAWWAGPLQMTYAAEFQVRNCFFCDAGICMLYVLERTKLIQIISRNRGFVMKFFQIGLVCFCVGLSPRANKRSISQWVEGTPFHLTWIIWRCWFHCCVALLAEDSLRMDRQSVQVLVQKYEAIRVAYDVGRDENKPQTT